jgi:hypothetical protein
MTLLTVVREVCAVVGVTAPTSVFASINSNRTMFEMANLANEMAQRIAYDGREWTKLKTSVTLIGDGHWVVTDPGPPEVKVWTGTSAFALPANYKYMLKSGNVWLSTSTQQPLRFISDTDEWLQRRAANESDAWGEWTLLGDYIHIWPIMSGFVPAVPYDPGPPEVLAKPAVPATTARFAYLDKNCVVLAAGGYGDRFVQDTDTFRLDERVLKLGMIWDWKSKKGSPYAEDMGTFEDALQRAQATDKPAPIIIDRMPISSYAHTEIPSQTIYVPRTPPFP